MLRTIRIILVLVVASAWFVTLGRAQSTASPPAVAPKASAGGSLDEFMAQVLAQRDRTWRTLHNYVLSEVETFSIDGPALIPLNGYKREYTWYIRDGFLVRSPLRFDGVTISEAERRRAETEWLATEKARASRTAKKGAEKSGASGQGAATDSASREQLLNQRGEPRFVSAAYFLRFKFEPGRYYLAGRERLDGREVLRIEYYPTRLFGDDDDARKPARPSTAESGGQAGGGAAKPPAASPKARQGGQKAGRKTEEETEEEMERKLNKVSLVTLWVDAGEHQIVRYTFDNVGFDFTPGRWFVRIEDISASMSMVRVFDGVWLPSSIAMNGALQFASGTLTIRSRREFFDYKKAEVGARIIGMSQEAR